MTRTKSPFSFDFEIQKSKHAIERMSQRGITQAEIDTVLDLGTPNGEKIALNRKGAAQHLHETRAEIFQLSVKMDSGECSLAEAMHSMAALEKRAKVLKKIEKKGGITIVMCESTLITAYRYASPVQRRRFH